MDPRRADIVTRTLASPASRRTLLGTSLAAALAMLGRTTAGAKKKDRRKYTFKNTNTNTSTATPLAVEPEVAQSPERR